MLQEWEETLVSWGTIVIAIFVHTIESNLTFSYYFISIVQIIIARILSEVATSDLVGEAL